ncbi:hypothetical protein [Demequina capsici]|uniref:Uncharacterized protein n=1 Tax=Demequina capsici TaxID=3075620 RepID=A0AA96J6P3_9MICO|nr:hypothetical protein [Demequina sp. OYTSA14]WNM23550.1 hypothetical protein RN606_09235 [Demequina sp. OYTSA14]
MIHGSTTVMPARLRVRVWLVLALTALAALAPATGAYADTPSAGGDSTSASGESASATGFDAFERDDYLGELLIGSAAALAVLLVGGLLMRGGADERRKD